MQTKKEVMDELTSTLELVHEKTKNNMLRSIGWINIMDNTAKEFKHDIEQTRLFNELEAGWEYIIEYSYSDFQLKLLHHEVTFDGNDQPQDIIDQVFTLVKTAAPYLTTAEYASLYGVGECLENTCITYTSKGERVSTCQLFVEEGISGFTRRVPLYK